MGKVAAFALHHVSSAAGDLGTAMVTNKSLGKFGKSFSASTKGVFL